MLDKKTTRRAVLKGSASIAGVAATASTVGLYLGHTPIDQGSDAEQAAQQRFIESILKKHAAKSRSSTPEEIAEFATRFTEVNGVVDYRLLFSTLSGEYRLTRLFIRSVRMGVKV